MENFECETYLWKYRQCHLPVTIVSELEEVTHKQSQMHEMVTVLLWCGHQSTQGWGSWVHTSVLLWVWCWARSMRITWELIRNARSPAHPDLLSQKLWGWGWQCIVTSPPILALAKHFLIPIPVPGPKQFALTFFVVSHVCLKCLTFHAKITQVLNTGEPSDTIYLYQLDWSDVPDVNQRTRSVLLSILVI